MAFIATIRVLVDEIDPDRAHEALEEMLQAAKSPADPDHRTAKSWLIDAKIEDMTRAASAVETAIDADTYQCGDAFGQWVVYSRSEAIANEENAGYWSNEYGWTSFDLATRFNGESMQLPISRSNDATLLMVAEDGRVPATEDVLSAAEVLEPFIAALSMLRRRAGVLSFQFKTSLQDRKDPDNARYHAHENETCALLRAHLGVHAEDCAEFDQEVLPAFTVGFDDGEDLLVFAEELTAQDDASKCWLTLVLEAFAFCREHDYVSVMDLIEEGTERDKRAFLQWGRRHGRRRLNQPDHVADRLRASPRSTA